ncbi:MAG: metallophosphoesterase family protein [Nitrospiraceae bacterium]|nr:metallophosphoesterase family protein [Nitrospiraceae bacterium]
MAEFAVISDVHGNLEALQAVLADIYARKKQRKAARLRILFIGDAVGYGPNPNECVAAIDRHAHVKIAGNHDWGVLGLTDISFFNANARAAIRWTGDVITPENRETLEGFRLAASIGKESIFLVHGSPKEPEEWHYILYMSDAEENFGCFSEKICIVGHSHLPFIMERLPSGDIVVEKSCAKLSENRFIINAGSVGQPRDGDPRACYLWLTGGTAEFIRVPYDMERTRRKIIAAGLPLPLADRLERGL